MSFELSNFSPALNNFCKAFFVCTHTLLLVVNSIAAFNFNEDVAQVP
jgi:hypothetical protein